MWDGYVQRTGITSFPYVVNNFAPNRQIDLGATDSLSNYGYSKRFLPTLAAVVAPEVVLNSGTFTSGVLAGSIAPGGSFGISWRVVKNDQISSTVALIDSNGNSASWVGGALVSGTAQDGTYQGSLSVPAGFTPGSYLICAIAISSTNLRSASQCGNRSEYVKVAALQVSTAWTPPANLSTPIYDDTYTRICLTQNWTNCGNWTIYNEVGTVVNRLVGPIPFTFCQTSGVNVCSGTPKGYAVLTGQYYAPTPVVVTPAGLGGYAVIHPDSHVCGVIVGNSYFAGNDRTMTSEYMGCPIGSKIIFQTKPSPSGNVAGYHGADVLYSNGIFRLGNGTTISNGIATDVNGRVWDTGTGLTIP